MNHLSARNIAFAYEDLKVLDGISFEVAAGELVAFVGPSGCGKTTLLRCLSGLLQPSSGNILTDPPVSSRHQISSFVFQRTTLLSWLTVRENLELPFLIKGREFSRAECEITLKRLGFDQFQDSFPGDLSIGMAQRIAYLRAISENRPLLLLDEPFASLDELGKREMASWLSEQVEQRRLSAVLVTHSVYEAVFLATRVIILTNRPTQIAAVVDIPLDTPRLASLWMADPLAPFVRKVRDALEASQ